MAHFAAQSLFPKWRGHLPWRDRASEAAENLHQTFPDLSVAIANHPFDRFEQIAAAAPIANYTHVPPPLAAFMTGVAETMQSPYLCALLLQLMEQFETRFRASGLDAEFELHYTDAFNRIIDQIKADPGFAVLSKDAFLKDLWIARMVMIPAFAQVWWPRSGLPGRDLMRAGPAALSFAYLRCGGRKPFFEGHTHDPMARAGYWNADGWAEALRLIALALPAFPRHKGAFGTAWFYDPAIETVSPKIRFASDLQVAKGAHRYRVGPNNAALANATATSPSRRRMVAEGSYVPTDYSIAWARRDLIAAYGPSNAARAARLENAHSTAA